MVLAFRRLLTLCAAALPGLVACLVAGLLPGCFVGDAADGLACEQDADCGDGVSCVADPQAAGAKCCGGSCLEAGNSTSPGSTNTTSGSSSSEDSSTTTVDLCGNGELDEGEICDASAPDGPKCGPECSLCGNDELDDREGCDNSANKNCGDDCFYLDACGNGTVDPGEACDWWGLPDGQTCNETCTQGVLFDWPTDRGVSRFCEDDEEGCIRWTQDTPNAPWGSGPYFNNGDLWEGDTPWPEATLRSATIAFPKLVEGDVVTIAVQHAYRLNFEDPEPGTERYVDYVELALEPSESSQLESADVPLGFTNIACVGTQGPVIVSADCTDALADDYCIPGLARGAGEFSSENAPMNYAYMIPDGGWKAGPRRLRFTLRYDCGNLANGDPESLPLGPDAWTISSVRVTVSTAGRGP